MTVVEAAGRWSIDPDPDPSVCARVLTAAFVREPAVSWICGSSTSARTRWFDATLRAHATLPAARRYTLTAANGQVVAAAVLTPPGAVPALTARAVWTARTGVRCGPPALWRTLRYLQLTEAVAPADTWTLEFVGVRPESAGTGAGGFLLDRVLADSLHPAVPRAKEATAVPAGCFLTTADPALVPLYRRFGFVELRRAELGPLHVTAMATTRPA
ncbi:GNAT family N-acetyltransferase [Streptomyces sp. 549]|uniref:GNAT family N-acetyltransferase n=1 Tax=Streptomyces sp. 549 TaxID=3049076 RepID=UPI0024C274D3|nr:GNAT family N-acetyltransferase [Streptomyces sp. 549]MDK1476442.1 GNAT family N-acetyltransferase [Streptomyces sp. 549]